MIACSDSGPTAPRAEADPVRGVTLLSPPEGGLIPQNDPQTGCGFHPWRGYGFQIRFDWTDAASPSGITGYDLYVRHAGATFPLIDTRVQESRYHFRSCNAFVIDPNLTNWQWSVRFIDGSGVPGEWVYGVFEFAPCRLENGDRCSAPG
jgi:hypothetical protein